MNTIQQSKNQMDPTEAELLAIENAMRQLPQEIAELVRRSRRAVAEAETPAAQTKAYDLYLSLINLADTIDATL